MKFPVVSIGLPAYNGEKYIARAILSALNQTYQNFELIVSDDGSTDGTRRTIKNFAKKDLRIKFFLQNNRLGFRKNFNFVLNHSRAKYFVWLAQDDYWDKNYLKKLVNLLEKNPKAVLAASGYQDVRDGVNHKFPLHRISNHETRIESLKKFIESGDLSIYYGLHLTSNLKSIGGYQKSSRPFFKSSDYLTIFRVLFGGPMVYQPEYLFFKEDTGNYLNRYEDLKNWRIDSGYLKKALRYAFFPIFFVYDLFDSGKYILFSDFTFREKLNLIFLVFICFIRRLLLFVISIFIGLFFLLKSIIYNLID